MKFIYGRNPVFELLKSDPDKIIRVLLANEIRRENIEEILLSARKNHCKIEFTNRHKLDSITGRAVHQGILAFIYDEKNNYDLDDILMGLREKEQKALFIIIDSIFDPQNLGSIIRTAEVTGVDGIIMPKHRSCKITPTVVKASAGATSYMPVIEVVNIVNCIMSLREKGVFIVGADMDAKDEYFNVDMNRDIAVVVGNEDEGIRRLVKEKCDLLVKIPVKGKISSLNVSVAMGVIIYEVIRQRK